MDIKDKIHPLLTGDDLIDALTFLPDYSSEIRKASASERLFALNEIYSLYIPSLMTCEVYHKLYFSLIRAMSKKNTLSSIQQGYLNRKSYNQGIMGGSDSFTIAGVSGIGKSSALSKAISTITNEEFFICEGTKIISFLTIQAPSDSSLKGLLLEILRKVDFILETHYHKDSIRARATLDMLIGTVSQVCLNHIGVLIIDEAQNLVGNKNGKNLVNALVQLINNSGISLCFVGTLECTSFFESAFHLARRSIGLTYTHLPYGEFFKKLCYTAFSFQYTTIITHPNESVIEWLYQHSNGITALVIGLIQSAQEIAIIDGYERLDIKSLNDAYQRRFGMLHGHINTSKKHSLPAHHSSIEIPSLPVGKMTLDSVFVKAIKETTMQNIDALIYLKQFVVIEEIDI